MRLWDLTETLSNGVKPQKKTQKETQKETITIQTQDVSFELNTDENLLDALIRTGHAVDYQCRSGYCGACRVKKTSGQVSYDDYPLAHLNNDEILPCACRVVSSSLTLDGVCRYAEDESQGELFD